MKKPAQWRAWVVTGTALASGDDVSIAGYRPNQLLVFLKLWLNFWQGMSTTTHRSATSALYILCAPQLRLTVHNYGRETVLIDTQHRTTLSPRMKQEAHSNCLVPPLFLPALMVTPVLVSMTSIPPHRWQLTISAGRDALTRSRTRCFGVSGGGVPSITVNLGLSVMRRSYAAIPTRSNSASSRLRSSSRV